jgi:hypothetical protein
VKKLFEGANAMNDHHYHLPVRPYSPIDALNRRSAALGSPRYAQGAHYADYNGHHVVVAWNSYRKYYVAQYMWAGPNVLARGSFEATTAAAIAEYNRGALGASVDVSVPENDVDSALRLFPQLAAGRCDFKPAWYTWRHECAAQAARDSANPRLAVMVFDWKLMESAETREVYEAALRAKHGRVYI